MVHKTIMFLRRAHESVYWHEDESRRDECKNNETVKTQITKAGFKALTCHMIIVMVQTSKRW